MNEQLQFELQPLWRFALHLTHDASDAEDLVQRTCVRALEQQGLYQETDQLRSWLYKIAQNIWRNEIRSRNIRERRSFAHGPGAEKVPLCEELPSSEYDSPESRVFYSEVYRAVESLPEAQRLVMVLIAVEGFSYRDTAKILEIPIGTVMSRLARARVTIGSRFLKSKAGEKEIDTAVH